MTAVVTFALIENITPTFKLSTRADPDTLLATVYTGTVSATRPTIYSFSTEVADGEYALTQLEYPRATGVVKIVGTSAKVYGSFDEMEAATAIGNVPKYGDDQIWDNGTDTLAVTVTEA